MIYPEIEKIEVKYDREYTPYFSVYYDGKLMCESGSLADIGNLSEEIEGTRKEVSIIKIRNGWIVGPYCYKELCVYYEHEDLARLVHDEKLRALALRYYGDKITYMLNKEQEAPTT